MRLSSDDTAALVQGMQNNVEEVSLGIHGAVELDWDTLLTYNGRGHCSKVASRGKTMERHGDQLAIWGKSMSWSVKKGIDVRIERK